MVSFNDYLNQNKTESKWNLRDGLLTVDIANTKTAEGMSTLWAKHGNTLIWNEGTYYSAWQASKILKQFNKVFWLYK